MVLSPDASAAAQELEVDVVRHKTLRGVRQASIGTALIRTLTVYTV